MKRSTQIGLVVAGALGVTSASGYYLNQRDAACRKNPDGTNRDCGHSGSAHWGRPLFGSSPTAQTPATSSLSSPATSAERGGFGSTGRAIGLSSGG